MVRGQRLLSIIIGFFEASIGIAAIAKIIRDVSGIYSILAYGAGFATGLFIGMVISDKISKNIMSTNIISNKFHNEIEEAGSSSSPAENISSASSCSPENSSSRALFMSSRVAL